jgi:hypothetical protein
MVRLRNLVSKAWEHAVNWPWYREDYVSKDSPVILGGCARSGTSLMMEIINAHPNIYCALETGLLYQKTITPKKLHSLSSKFNIDESALTNLKNESKSHFEFIESFFNLLRIREEKPRWGEKSPENVLNLNRIFHHFPDSRFLHIIRDGRDVSCSLRTFPRYKMVNGRRIELDTLNPLDKCIQRWVKDVSSGLLWRDDSRYYEIKYENIVDYREAPLKKVFKFLDEPWNEKVTKFFEKNDKQIRSDKIVQNPGVKEPIYKKAKRRWEKEFSEEDKKTFKKIGGNLLIELGYEKDNNW